MAVHSELTTEYCSKISSEKRKAKKPLMEKMRRARINDSLNELKTLVLESLNKDAARYSKMEKADILEMSVQYLREMRKQEKSKNDSTLAEYRAGFNYCAQEVTKNLSIIESPGSDKLRTGLMHHLASRCQGNMVKSPAPVCVPVASSTQGFPAENQTIHPVASMFVYPSPPPSPLYLSPPVSPTLAQGVILTDQYFPHKGIRKQRATEDRKPSEEKSTKTSIPTSNQFWRPWKL